MTANESIVSADTPMPAGYNFLRRGNTFTTALCRHMTREAGETLYIVHDNGTLLGFRVPRWILAEIWAEGRRTRSKRFAAVAKRNGATENDLKRATLRLFPGMPPEDVATMLKRALTKRSERIGRISLLTIDRKVRRAVGAHIRHHHTKYVEVLRTGQDKGTARQEVRDEIAQVMEEWRARPSSMPKRGARNMSTKATTTALQPKPNASTADGTTMPSTARNPEARPTPARHSSGRLNEGPANGGKKYITNSSEEDYETSEDDSLREALGDLEYSEEDVDGDSDLIIIEESDASDEF